MTKPRQVRSSVEPRAGMIICHTPLAHRRWCLWHGTLWKDPPIHPRESIPVTNIECSQTNRLATAHACAQCLRHSRPMLHGSWIIPETLSTSKLAYVDASVKAKPKPVPHKLSVLRRDKAPLNSSRHERADAICTQRDTRLAAHAIPSDVLLETAQRRQPFRQAWTPWRGCRT